MIDFSKLSLEEKEIVIIVAKLESILPETLNNYSFDEIKSKAKEALTEYYRDHTQMASSGWAKKFEDAGITEDEGKSAISCARRIGILIE